MVVELTAHELGFMAAILEATLDIGEALLVHPEPGTAMDVSEEAPLWQQLEPQAAGAASMTWVPGFEYGGEAQEVIQFMLQAASPERRPIGAGQARSPVARPPWGVRCGCVSAPQKLCSFCGVKWWCTQCYASECACVPEVERHRLGARVYTVSAQPGLPAQRLQPKPCISQEGHDWLVECRYEPPKCEARSCGQGGCDASFLCNCADPAAHPASPVAHCSPGLAPGNFLAVGEARLVIAPVSPIPCGSQLRAACPLSPRVQLQQAPTASPVVVREPAAAHGVHMRPKTAAALRQLGASKLVSKLALDESEWALLPHQKERLSSIVQAVAAAKLAAIPVNTSKADGNGVRWLGLVCEDLDTTPLRPGPEHAFEDREALLGAHFICFHAEHAKVNPHFAITPSGAQRTRVKPSSSFSAYLAARRALEDYGSYVPPMKPVLKVLKGLDKQMLLEFGEDALAKIQALPWSTSQLDAFQGALTSGDKLQW